MKKKKSGGGGANWMDTYGDMVTLLLCFFVLLYSMSTISEDKWKAIVQSFNPMAIPVVTDPSGLGGPYADPDIGDLNAGMMDPSEMEDAQKEIDTIIEELAAAIEQMVSSDGLDGSVSVELTGGKIYVKFSDQVFFPADRYNLLPNAQEILTHLCGILDGAKDAIEEIRVQGHTAQGSPYQRNDPDFDRFLASNRATEVVLFMQENSTIHPARLVSEGWGQWHPISSNQTAESRAFNRRVEMIITGRDLETEALGEAIQSYISQDSADMGLDE